MMCPKSHLGNAMDSASSDPSVPVLQFPLEEYNALDDPSVFPCSWMSWGRVTPGYTNFGITFG